MDSDELSDFSEEEAQAIRARAEEAIKRVVEEARAAKQNGQQESLKARFLEELQAARMAGRDKFYVRAIGEKYKRLGLDTSKIVFKP